jgi:hypothetical protein
VFCVVCVVCVQFVSDRAIGNVQYLYPDLIDLILYPDIIPESPNFRNPAVLQTPQTYSVFIGHDLLVSGPLAEVAIPVKRALEDPASHHVLVFDNLTGRQVDFDLTGSETEVRARFSVGGSASGLDVSPEPRRRGRPRLGVVAREVTLLPRHWEWLATQPGGASVALRKLVELARRANGSKQELRQRQERAYQFMSSIGGNLAGFEEASRALFANDETGLRERLASWPADVRDLALRLAHDGGTTYLSNE